MPAAIEDLATAKLLRGTGSWKEPWQAVIRELRSEDLITDDELALLFDSSGESVPVGCPANREARRRLQFLQRSLDDPQLPTCDGVLAAPCMTVLVPHYAETLVQQFEDVPGLKKEKKGSAVTRRLRKAPSGQEGLLGCGPLRCSRKLGLVGRTSHELLHESEMRFIVAYKSDEYRNFLSRIDVKHPSVPGKPGVIEAIKQAQRTRELRKWASMRLQTLYRTVEGMMKHRQALSLLLASQLPSLSEEERTRIVDSKFTMLAALQRCAETIFTQPHVAATYAPRDRHVPAG